MWLKDGNKNSKFFHNSTKERCKVNKNFQIIFVEGCLLDNPDQIIEEVVSFFQNLLNDWEGLMLSVQQSLLECILRLVKDEQNTPC